MLREKIEGKWIAAFRRFLTLNGVGAGVPIAIVAESQSRPVLVELAEIAAYDLGADYFTLVLPTLEQSAPVVVRSTGSSDAIQHKRPVIEALKAVDAIVDVTVEGLIHAAEMPEIHNAGTRLIVICNEHPEILERTEPDASLGPNSTSAFKCCGMPPDEGNQQGGDRSFNRYTRCSVRGTPVFNRAGLRLPLAGRPLPLLSQSEHH